MMRVKKPSDKWYSRACWRNLRKLVLHKDPICCICKRAPSTCVDHITAHCGDWSLFLDIKNCQGLCDTCHSAKTVKENMGFGNAPRPAGPFIAPTGSKKGSEWIAATVSQEALDKALKLDADFLDGVPS